jgi:hypothetical protein
MPGMVALELTPVGPKTVRKLEREIGKLEENLRRAFQVIDEKKAAEERLEEKLERIMYLERKRRGLVWKKYNELFARSLAMEAELVRFTAMRTVIVEAVGPKMDEVLRPMFDRACKAIAEGFRLKYRGGH